MKAYTPEISWHNHGPILCLDVQQESCVASLEAQLMLKGTNLRAYRIATGGNDQNVYIWMVSFNDARPDKKPHIEVRAALRRHQKTVGCLRFSPPSTLPDSNRPPRLASGDDDGYIILWQYHPDSPDEQSTTNGNGNNGSWESSAFGDDNVEPLETWRQYKVLRGHVEDVCDLSWSKDGARLISGSVDNSAIVWDVDKAHKLWTCDGSRGFVHGVALDPHNELVAAISADRNLRIYDSQSKKLTLKFRQSLIKYRDIPKCKATFIDDTLKSFCRRLEFSPCGEFLLVPSGTIQMPELAQANNEMISSEQHPLDKSSTNGTATNGTANGKSANDTIAAMPKHVDAAFLYRRNCLNKPCCYYPTGGQSALCVRFCPVYFKLRDHQQNLLNLPYRIVFAIATSRSILIYDTQQATPIGYLSQIHLARLTDLSWSDDARLLMISSYDAYSSIVEFDLNEFGEPYVGPTFVPTDTKVVQTKEKKEKSTFVTPKEAKPTKPVISPPRKNVDQSNHKLYKWLKVSPKAPPNKRLRES